MVEENEVLKNKVEEMNKVNDESFRKARRVYEKRVWLLMFGFWIWRSWGRS